MLWAYTWWSRWFGSPLTYDPRLWPRLPTSRTCQCWRMRRRMRRMGILWGQMRSMIKALVVIYTYGTRNRRIPSVAQKNTMFTGKTLGFGNVGFSSCSTACSMLPLRLFAKKNAWALRLEKGLEGWIGKLWDPKATSYVKDYRFPIYVSFKVFHPSHSSTLGTVYVTKFGPLVIGTL